MGVRGGVEMKREVQRSWAAAGEMVRCIFNDFMYAMV